MKKLLTSSALILGTLVACSSDDDSGTSALSSNLVVTISGEEHAAEGFLFPAASADEPAFVDGWELTFDRILVTVDSISLSEGPDTNPTDQSQTGAVVARVQGPWAVDLSKPGAAVEGQTSLEADSASLQAEGKDPSAQQLAHLRALDGNRSFDPSARYAFGFDVVAATAGAKLTNLDAAAQADYADMQAKGISVLYVGRATFKGVDCRASDATYDFTKLPTTVKFRLGFTTPSSYRNCQNTDLRGLAFDGEEAQRGIQVKSTGTTVAQITLHTDHPWFNTVDHDAAELFFDQMAAAADADGNLVIDDLASVDFTSFKDQSGAVMPWRSCVADKAPKAGTRAFDPGSVAVNPSASAADALRNYSDYVRYQQSAQGHLNADGLCAVSRNFESPR